MCDRCDRLVKQLRHSVRALALAEQKHAHAQASRDIRENLNAAAKSLFGSPNLDETDVICDELISRSRAEAAYDAADRLLDQITAECSCGNRPIDWTDESELFEDPE